MNNIQTTKLNDGRRIQVSDQAFPIAMADQIALIDLWRTEWNKTELDWLAAMNGDYSQTLSIVSLIGTIDGTPAGTATIYYAVDQPEVALVGSVLTHPKFRGLGIATHLTNRVVDIAWNVGCRVGFLGATRDPRSVYLHCGFEWWNGGVMRRAAVDSDNCESQFFAAGQITSIREAVWGDLPGMTCFAIQPLDCYVLDYPRELHSGKYGRLQWCVSVFPAVWYNVTERGGSMSVLIGESSHRVLGFGTLTPARGPSRGHKAVIDVATHDNYENCGPDILAFVLAKAAEREIKMVQAYVAVRDQIKLRWFQEAGLEQMVTLPGQLCVEGEMIDVIVLEGRP